MTGAERGIGNSRGESVHRGVGGRGRLSSSSLPGGRRDCCTTSCGGSLNWFAFSSVSFFISCFFFPFFFWLFFGQTARNRATFTLCSVAAFHFGSAANCNLPFTHSSPSSPFRSCSRSRSQATINQRVR